MSRWLALVVVAACGASSPHDARVAAPADASALVVDRAAFAPFARDVRARFASADLATSAGRDRRFVIAILNALDDRWPEAVAELDAIGAAEPDPRAKIMTGLSIRIWADARAHGGDTAEAFQAALERAIASLPIDLVRADLAMLRAMGRVFTPEVCRQLVAQAVHPDHGTVGEADIHAIVFQRYAVVRLVPVGTVIDTALAARGIDLPADGEP